MQCLVWKQPLTELVPGEGQANQATFAPSKPIRSELTDSLPGRAPTAARNTPRC